MPRPVPETHATDRGILNTSGTTHGGTGVLAVFDPARLVGTGLPDVGLPPALPPEEEREVLDSADPSFPGLTIDPEIRYLVPPLSYLERRQLDASVRAKGCLDPLFAWRDGGKLILLDGHNRYEVCKIHNRGFRVRVLRFATKDEAKEWVSRWQLGRRNASEEGKAYLRGARYLLHRKKPGRRRGAADNPGKPLPPKTAQLLAQADGVSPSTVRRAARFALAVDAVARHCGDRIKERLLHPDEGWTQRDILLLAGLEPDKLKSILAEEGPPKRLLQPFRAPRKRSKLSVPTAPAKLARALVKQLDGAQYEEACRELVKRLGPEALQALARQVTEWLEHPPDLHEDTAAEANPAVPLKPGKRGRPRKQPQGAASTSAEGNGQGST
jgi:hypothetical protein